jgi:hypothetical protein
LDSPYTNGDSDCYSILYSWRDLDSVHCSVSLGSLLLRVKTDSPTKAILSEGDGRSNFKNGDMFCMLDNVRTHNLPGAHIRIWHVRGRSGMSEPPAESK